jgi:hypothetical protein
MVLRLHEHLMNFAHTTVVLERVELSIPAAASHNLSASPGTARPAHPYEIMFAALVP